MKAILPRLKDGDKETLGSLLVYNGLEKAFECKTLELPWKGNKLFVSCIPKGKYWVNHRYSPKHGDHLEIEDVVYRTCILIHVVNYVKDLEGCIGVGRTHTDIDGDGLLDITSSRNTLDALIAIVPKKGMSLEII